MIEFVLIVSALTIVSLGIMITIAAMANSETMWDDVKERPDGNGL